MFYYKKDKNPSGGWLGNNCYLFGVVSCFRYTMFERKGYQLESYTAEMGGEWRIYSHRQGLQGCYRKFVADEVKQKPLV